MNEPIASRIEGLKRTKVSKSHQKLIDYMETADYTQIMYFTITEFAKATGTGEATILRFCRQLGFDGYQVFKLQIARELSNRHAPTDDSASGGDFLTDIFNAYRAAISTCISCVEGDGDKLDKLVSMITSAKRICCFGVGNSYGAALELHNRLMSFGIQSLCERDVHLQNILASSGCENDLMIVFSVSGSTKDVVEATKLASYYGVKVALVTAHNVSPLSKISDLVISTGEADIYREAGLMTNKIVQLFLIDALCQKLYSSDTERFSGYISKSRAATVGKLV